MIIRQYKNKDCDIVSKLFYETVHSVNAKDYTVEQLSVWANNADSLKIRHNDYQKQGVATALCNELEKDLSIIKTYSSITAKPFFERRGYVVVKAQEVERLGVKLKNYEMQKKNAT